MRAASDPGEPQGEELGGNSAEQSLSPRPTGGCLADKVQSSHEVQGPTREGSFNRGSWSHDTRSQPPGNVRRSPPRRSVSFLTLVHAEAAGPSGGKLGVASPGPEARLPMPSSGRLPSVFEHAAFFLNHLRHGQRACDIQGVA